MWSFSYTGDVGKDVVVGDVGEIVECWQVELDSDVSNANHQTSGIQIKCTCVEHPLWQYHSSQSGRDHSLPSHPDEAPLHGWPASRFYECDAGIDMCSNREQWFADCSLESPRPNA